MVLYTNIEKSFSTSTDTYLKSEYVENNNNKIKRVIFINISLQIYNTILITHARFVRIFIIFVVVTFVLKIKYNMSIIAFIFNFLLKGEEIFFEVCMYYVTWIVSLKTHVIPMIFFELRKSDD